MTTTEPESLPCTKCGSVDFAHTAGADVCRVCWRPRAPESLDAWARRTAPTLTDRDWSEAASLRIRAAIYKTSPRPLDAIACVAALLAELVRIAGELDFDTYKAGWCLERIANGGLHGYTGCAGACRKLHRLGLITQPRTWGTWCTPLGRAVLARKAVQR